MLIYNLIVMFLLEGERLMADFMVERMNPRILQAAAWFKTESNARIVRFAMAQEIWPRKLCMVCRLHGRRDADENILAEPLRMLRGISIKPIQYSFISFSSSFIRYGRIVSDTPP